MSQNPFMNQFLHIISNTDSTAGATALNSFASANKDPIQGWIDQSGLKAKSSHELTTSVQNFLSGKGSSSDFTTLQNFYNSQQTESSSESKVRMKSQAPLLREAQQVQDSADEYYTRRSTGRADVPVVLGKQKEDPKKRDAA